MVDFVKSYVEAQGRSIGATSRPGEDSTFTVTLPIRETKAELTSGHVESSCGFTDLNPPESQLLRAGRLVRTHSYPRQWAYARRESGPYLNSRNSRPTRPLWLGNFVNLSLAWCTVWGKATTVMNRRARKATTNKVVAETA